MIAAAVLVFVVIVYRVVLGFAGTGADPVWLHNFSPLAAIALCGAIYFPRRVALAFPLLALLISDFILNAHYNAPMLSSAILPRYVALALVGGFGWLLRSNPRVPFVLASSLAGSTLFFVVSNTGSWIFDPFYAKTVAGWTTAMTGGRADFHPTTLEFFRNTVVSDLAFTLLFMGCVALQARRGTTPAPVRTRELAQW